MTRPSDAEIDRRVQAWHKAPRHGSAPLHEALGWTATEYKRWVHDPSAVPERPLPAWPGAAP